MYGGVGGGGYKKNTEPTRGDSLEMGASKREQLMYDSPHNLQKSNFYTAQKDGSRTLSRLKREQIFKY